LKYTGRPLMELQSEIVTTILPQFQLFSSGDAAVSGAHGSFCDPDNFFLNSALDQQQIACMSEARPGETPGGACITSYRTSEADIKCVVAEMNRLAPPRRAVRRNRPTARRGRCGGCGQGGHGNVQDLTRDSAAKCERLESPSWKIKHCYGARL
jgi:hypothetical protein